MKMRFYTLGLLALISPFLGQLSLACTPLPILLKDIRDGSPILHAARSDVKRAKNSIALSKSSWKPQLSVFGRTAVGDSQFGQTQTDNSLGVRASQRLFDFGRAKLDVQAAGFEMAEAEARSKVVSEEEALIVTMAYVDMLEVLESLKVLQQRSQYLAEHEVKLSAMLREGATTISQFAEAKAERAGTDADISTLTHQLMDARLKISSRANVFKMVCDLPSVNRWVGIKISSINNLPTNTRPQMAENSPAYQAELSRFEALKTRARLSKKSRLPVLEVVGTSTYGYDNIADKWGQRNQIGIEVSVPLVTGGRHRSEERMAALDAEKSSFQALEIAQRLEQNIDLTQSKIAALKAEQIARARAMQAADEQMAAANKEYAVGARSFSNLVEVRLKRDQSVLTEIRARHELSRQQIFFAHYVKGLNSEQ